MGMSHVHRPLLSVVFVATALLLTSCVSKPELRSDYDHGADFSKFRTFNFVQKTGTDAEGYSHLVTQEFEAAIRSEMEKRGYVFDPKPELLVNFSGKLQEKQEVQSSPGSYYGYRGYGAWAGYGYVGGDVYTVNYTMGTINVDLVDAQRNQMVWEGVAQGEVTKKALEDRKASIQKAVSHIFSKFPFRAGSGQPVTPETSK